MELEENLSLREMQKAQSVPKKAVRESRAQQQDCLPRFN